VHGCCAAVGSKVFEGLDVCEVYVGVKKAWEEEFGCAIDLDGSVWAGGQGCDETVV